MRLPDSVLLRGDGSARRRNYCGRPYRAVSAWTSEEEGRAEAQTIRRSGGFAWKTRERRPLTSYDREILRGERRKWAASDRYMWLVWTAEKPAHADRTAPLSVQT